LFQGATTESKEDLARLEVVRKRREADSDKKRAEAAKREEAIEAAKVAAAKILEKTRAAPSTPRKGGKKGK
jgi:hypothetical protein